MSTITIILSIFFLFAGMGLFLISSIYTGIGSFLVSIIFALYTVIIDNEKKK